MASQLASAWLEPPPDVALRRLVPTVAVVIPCAKRMTDPCQRASSLDASQVTLSPNPSTVYLYAAVRQQFYEFASLTTHPLLRSPRRQKEGRGVWLPNHGLRGTKDTRTWNQTLRKFDLQNTVVKSLSHFQS